MQAIKMILTILLLIYICLNKPLFNLEMVNNLLISLNKVSREVLNSVNKPQFKTTRSSCLIITNQSILINKKQRRVKLMELQIIVPQEVEVDLLVLKMLRIDLVRIKLIKNKK